MKKRLLVYGAGAIGRGFLPWVFPPSEFDYFFVDKNATMMRMFTRFGCTSYCIKDGQYVGMEVKPLHHMPVEYDAVITAVGTRSFMGLMDRFMGTTIPVICLENDGRISKLMSEVTGNPNIVFGVPDVITSNTSSAQHKQKDPLSLITEDGVCYIDDRVKALGGKAIYLDHEGMRNEWLAKLYVHNTPHCIAAYMGYLMEARFVCDAMLSTNVETTIRGVMEEMVKMVSHIYKVDLEFLTKYAAKEIGRFANPLLLDPITRVAREPLRKLAIAERLIGAATLCLQAGFIPKNTIKGVLAALQYDDPKDPDYRIMKARRKVSSEVFLKMVGLPASEPLYPLLLEAMREQGHNWNS